MVSLEDDLLAEGEPEREFHAGIAGRLPGKRVASAALIRDEQGRILLLDPTYKPDWVLPGGMVESGEDPVGACVRELQEELGIDLVPGSLLVVDWVPAHGVWGDSLQFVFDGGVMGAEQFAGLRLQAEEIVSASFVTEAEAEPHVRPSMARRLASARAAREQGATWYLRYGRPMHQPGAGVTVG